MGKKELHKEGGRKGSSSKEEKRDQDEPRVGDKFSPRWGSSPRWEGQ